MRKIFRSRAFSGILAVVLGLTILLNLFQADRVHALQNQINSVYHKAFFETLALMDSIGANLEKIMISGSTSKEQELLGTISRQADAAQDNLSVLPASLSSISGALKFVNQLGDFSQTLNEQISMGGAITDADYELLMTLYASCQELNALFAETSSDLLAGDGLFDHAAAYEIDFLPGDTQTDSSVEYPSLLYDGPFSDGRQTDRLLALDDVQYTADQALELARRFIGEERVLSIRLTGEGTTPVPCWEISAHVREGELSLAVTRQGGQILYIICDKTPEESRFSQAELIDLASAFLKSRGYPSASVSYWAFDNHIITINFAAMQDGVVLYPDLIKVQMDASTGLIVGWEALNYLANHIQRAQLTPTLSEEDARSRLGALLSVQHSRLCVIPTNTDEALAWEFSGTANENRYLVYIDALTGNELEIYRVIESENGQLAI